MVSASVSGPITSSRIEKRDGLRIRGHSRSDLRKALIPLGNLSAGGRNGDEIQPQTSQIIIVAWDVAMSLGLSPPAEFSSADELS